MIPYITAKRQFALVTNVFLVNCVTKFAVIYGGYDMDDQEINEISNTILEKLTTFIDEKFESVEKRLGQVEKRLDQISDDIESIREHLNLERSRHTGRVMPYKKNHTDYGSVWRP